MRPEYCCGKLLACRIANVRLLLSYVSGLHMHDQQPLSYIPLVFSAASSRAAVVSLQMAYLARFSVEKLDELQICRQQPLHHPPVPVSASLAAAQDVAKASARGGLGAAAPLPAPKPKPSRNASTLPESIKEQLLQQVNVASCMASWWLCRQDFLHDVFRWMSLD